MNPTPLLPAILLRLFAVLVVVATTASAAIPADLDGDGKVSVADHLRLQQFLRGERTLTPTERAAADMDGSGSITVADLDILRDVLLERFPPAVVAANPATYSVVGNLETIDLTFNKPYHDDGHLGEGVGLFEAGPDRHLGTADDIAIPGSLAAAPPSLGFTLEASAGPGTYGLLVGPPIADFQGRPMIPFLGKFLISGDDPTRDSDFDGIPDLEEIASGTNPLLADSDGDFADDLLERDSGTDPNDPESVPGEIINPRTRAVVMNSLAVSYANFPVENATTSPDWISVRSPVVSYVNLPIDPGTTPADWITVRSPVLSYSNLPTDAGTTQADWITVLSPVVSYANLPTGEGTTPAGWITVLSPVVSYANIPTDEGTTPAGWITVRSPVVSYLNAPVENADPGLSKTVTIASPVISYENTANL